MTETTLTLRNSESYLIASKQDNELALTVESSEFPATVLTLDECDLLAETVGQVMSYRDSIERGAIVLVSGDFVSFEQCLEGYRLSCGASLEGDSAVISRSQARQFYRFIKSH